MKALLFVTLLAGCAAAPSPGYDPSKLTPDQIAALAADRSLLASCTLVTSLGGRAVTVFAQLDRATIPAGGSLLIDGATCRTEINLDPPQPKAPPQPIDQGKTPT